MSTALTGYALAQKELREFDNFVRSGVQLASRQFLYHFTDPRTAIRAAKSLPKSKIVGHNVFAPWIG